VSRWQAVIFDLDDTLYAERDYVESGMRAVAAWAERELGLPAERSFGELFTLFQEGIRGDTFNRWLLGHDFDADEWAPAMVRAYRNHAPQIRLYPEVADLLRSLDCRHRLGIVTDGYLAVQRRKVAALGLDELVDTVVYSDRWGRAAWKPSRRPFCEVLARLGAEPARSVYVADNPAKDFFGPRRLGMTAIRIRHAAGLHCRSEPPTPEHRPHLEIARLEDLQTMYNTVDNRGPRTNTSFPTTTAIAAERTRRTVP